MDLSQYKNCLYQIFNGQSSKIHAKSWHLIFMVDLVISISFMTVEFWHFKWKYIQKIYHQNLKKVKLYVIFKK